jgi:hypothetical protein
MDDRRLLWVVVPVAFLAAALCSCGDGGGGAAAPFTLHVEPEFIQGVVTGAANGLLVTIEDGSSTDDPVTLSATATDAEVTVSPQSISAGEVAEVVVVAGSGPDGRPIDIVVTGRRGDVEATATRSTSVYDWQDDRGEYARTLLEVFTAWLEANEPGFAITADTGFEGSFVAPGLLVVSHYMFLSDEWEVGLSWHVMLPPDDWAEIYLRPRDELGPSAAFRLASQDAALNDAAVDIAAVDPPEEVVR